jgi:hypothetical protein
MEEAIQNLLTQIQSHGVLWIPNIANVLPLLDGDNQGGYGVVHKVRIKRFDHIPNTIGHKHSKVDNQISLAIYLKNRKNNNKIHHKPFVCGIFLHE